MRFLFTVTTACLVALGSLACEDVVTTPNSQNAAGPKVTVVTLCHFREDNKCFLNAGLVGGTSVVLEAVAVGGTVNVTSACDFAWKSNSSSIRVEVGQPSRTAVVTSNAHTVGYGGTVTATCNGVTGAFSINFL